MTEHRPVSLRDLAFVRDVLIPRAWVSGEEVDELVRLRARLDRYFDGLRQPAAPAPSPPTHALPSLPAPPSVPAGEPLPPVVPTITPPSSAPPS